MVDRDNLEESAALGVTAIILIFATILTLKNLIQNFKEPKYPRAQ